MRRASWDTFPLPRCHMRSGSCEMWCRQCAAHAYHLRHQNERGVPKVHFVIRFEFFVFSERGSDFRWAKQELQGKSSVASC